MQEVIIIGNSGAARECRQILLDSIAVAPTLRYLLKFKGFLSFHQFKGTLGELAHLEIGNLESWKISGNELFIIGAGKPELRQEVFEDVKSRGGQFLNLISPLSYIPADMELGEGNIITSGCNFSTGTRIGNANYFNGEIRMGHDVDVGNFNFFGPGAFLLGNVSVGDSNILAVRSVLLDHARIGSFNHVHPGSVIYKGCRDNCRMAGNPALKI